MTQAYLYFNAAAYIVFAVWCTLMPEKTAGFLGLALPTASGKSEYITVYGGLEFGVAMFFLVCAIKPELRSAGLLFALLFYGGLIVWRLGTFVFLSGIGRTTFYFGASELLLGLAALGIWLTQRAAPTPN